MEIMRRLVQEEEGQGLVEYALIIGLISVAAIAFIPEIGKRVAIIFKKIQDALPAA
ncbi:Flp family type IVb pilin [Trichococcus pasteurii]|uniref:Flp/fap pilin component n=1 Tax=Trichococcus pasteurii TaxID=43064 RepID=A0A1W1IFI8_9LACT|nr:Flp family type IVb pilin [Trichococcus pasteurii]SFE45534.1 pilus assembly protein Flp/PilA [Trichococcus pasteurii]SLM51671.1 flp/fap pilin component [Trichococcus pasteurii]SSB92552.1 flp/fap pilin component [Trichococcus pasteurii]